MSNPLTDASIPVVPELLNQWGIRGKLLYTQLTQSLQGGETALKVMREYVAGDNAIEEYINATDNELTRKYGELKAENEAADTKDAEARAAEIKAINDKYDDAKAKRDANVEAVREEIAASSGIERVSDDDNAEAVEMWDMVRTAIDTQRSLARDTLANKSVPNPDYDPTVEGSKETLSIGDVIDSVKLPDIGLGSKKVRATKGKGDTAWRPRWNKAVIDGAEQSDPTVQGVADTIGLSRERTLDSFLRFHTRDNFDGAEAGTEWSFSANVDKDGVQKVHQITVTKGTFSTK